jgi:hypothetical protein
LTWQKRGRIYAPDASFWWAKSYAHSPTPYLMDDCIRVYYAGLDENHYGRIGYVDLEKDNPSQIRYIAPEPILDLGDLGTFDDCGLVPSFLMKKDDSFYLYYSGFQRTERVPYMLFAGMAMSRDGIHFERYSQSPILDRNPEELFLRSAPTILFEDGLYKLWYASAVGWTTVNGQPYPQYHIRHAHSRDAIHWQTEAAPSIDFGDDDEFGLARPWIFKENNQYTLWYSIRSRSRPYRVGKAISKDGLNWQRVDDEISISVSAEGWDSEMICYPTVIELNNQKLMFYNGNRHGSTGFGYAVWED